MTRVGTEQHKDLPQRVRSLQCRGHGDVDGADAGIQGPVAIAVPVVGALGSARVPFGAPGGGGGSGIGAPLLVSVWLTENKPTAAFYLLPACMVQLLSGALLAVAGAASLFTPIATPANTMVFAPGGYRFTDYWKLGLPLAVLYISEAVLSSFTLHPAEL